MKKILDKVLLGLIVLMLFVHVLILFGVIPASIVWARQITDQSSLIKYESFAFIVLLIFFIIILLKIRFLKAGKNNKFVNIGVWVIFGYFVFNTLANLASRIVFEKLVFASFTILLAVLTFILGKRKN